MTSTAGLPLASPALRRFSTESSTVAMSDPHRGTVAIGDDEGTVLIRLARLVVGIDLKMTGTIFDRPLGTVRVRRGERGTHVLGADAVFEESVRVELDAHRRQRAAADGDLADALDLRQLLLEHRRRRVVELALAQRARGERQDHDGRIG